jgi:alpha-ribazole phosphatase
MPKLLLVRHGMTNLQKEDRFWGNTDVQLNELGITQAKQIRDRLLPEKVTHVYSSTLSRARDTAKIIAAPFKKEVTACEELCECNFGYLEGLSYDEIKRMHPKVAEELGKMEGINFPGGESMEEFYTRVQKFLSRLKKHKQQDVIVIAAHGGSLRMLICHLLELELKHWSRIQISRASISIVDTYPRISILNVLNDTSHLKMGER